jgi:hypothetical protein
MVQTEMTEQEAIQILVERVCQDRSYQSAPSAVCSRFATRLYNLFSPIAVASNGRDASTIAGRFSANGSGSALIISFQLDNIQTARLFRCSDAVAG